MAVDGSGNLYLAYTTENRIQKFDPQGNFVSAWGNEDGEASELVHPVDVAVDRNGYVYVTEYENNRVKRFDSRGNFVSMWGSNGTGNGEFDGPTDIAVDSFGSVYVADPNNTRIQKFDQSGRFLVKWDFPRIQEYGASRLDITIDGYDNVYVVDNYNHRIQKFRTEGSIDETFITINDDGRSETFALIFDGRDADGDGLTWSIATQPTNGTASVGATGPITAAIDFAPTAGYAGEDSFKVMISDGELSSTVTVYVTIKPINEPPIAVYDIYGVSYATPLIVEAPGLLNNDSDVDGNPLTAHLFGGPSKGSLDLSANGSFVYTPTRGMSGSDSFTYLANDGTVNSNVATAYLTIEDAPTHPLSVHVVDDMGSSIGGSVALDPPGASYPDLDTVNLSALPEVGYHFSHWSGDLDGANATLNLLMDGPKSVTAHFSSTPPTTYILTTKISGNGTVSLSSSIHRAGEEVTLTATPNEGWQFVGYSGDLVSSQSMETVVMDRDKMVTVTFSRILPVFSASVIGSGTVTISSGVPTYGETVSVHAVADPGWQFDGWSGDIVGTTTPVDLIMDGYKQVIATFVPQTDEPDSITETPTDPTNVAPIAADDDASTAAGVPIAIDVLTNDDDVDGDKLTITTISQPMNGTVTQDGTKLVFTPDVGFSGLARFTYAISDGHDGTDSAEVIITVAEEVTDIEVDQGQETVVDIEETIQIREDDTVQDGLMDDERTSDSTVQTTIVIPADALTSSMSVSESISLNFAWLDDDFDQDLPDNSPKDEPADGLERTPIRFVMDAIMDDILAPDVEFAKPVMMTLIYDERLLENLLEATLEVRYWDIHTQAWETEDVFIVEHDLENNQLIIEIWHLTEFAIFAQPASPTSLDEVEEPALKLSPALFLPLVQ